MSPKITLYIIAATLALTTGVRATCPTIPLCCSKLVYGPNTDVTNTVDSLGIVAPPGGFYPAGISCVPIENPPADYILYCASPNVQVCCKYNTWGGKIALQCQPDPPVTV